MDRVYQECRMKSRKRGQGIATVIALRRHLNMEQSDVILACLDFVSSSREDFAEIIHRRQEN